MRKVRREEAFAGVRARSPDPRVLAHADRRDVVAPHAAQIGDVVSHVGRTAAEVSVEKDADLGAAEHADGSDRVVEVATELSVLSAAADAEVAPSEIGVLEEARAFARHRLAAPLEAFAVRFA